MKRRRLALASALAVLSCVPRGARADVPPFEDPGDGRAELAPRSNEPPVAWAMMGGVGTALVPLAIGSALFANSFDTDRRKGASIAIVSGLALAPIVSHLIVKEWTRAAIFGAIPVLCAVGMTTLLEIQPSATVFGTREGRLTFGLTLAVATLSAGVGLADTLAAGRRAAERARAGSSPSALTRKPRTIVVPLPFATPGGGGLGVVGLF